MALRISSNEQWTEFLKNTLNFPAEDATVYGTSLHENGVTDDTMHTVIQMENSEARKFLLECGVSKSGHSLAMVGFFRRINSQNYVPVQPATTPHITTHKPPRTPRPTLTLDMTPQAFRKFCYDWHSFKGTYNIPPDKYRTELYQCCSKDVQNSVFASHPQFLTHLTDDTEQTILNTLKSIVTPDTNCIVHRMAFRKIHQSPNETCKDYLNRIRSAAPECDFTCPSCKADMSP